MWIELSSGMVIAIARETLLTAIILAGPPLLVGMLVGLIISMFQAVTQIHEQTLTFVPKILAILIALLVFGPWMLKIITDFSVNILGNLHNVIR
jgi:flagellar biosynthetic protein FliQ